MAEEKEAKEKKRPSRSKKSKATLARGKRKEAIARASISDGKGHVWINGVALEAQENILMKELVTQALSFADAKGIDVRVTTNGGGFAGQAQAARTAVAKAMVNYFTKDAELRQRMLDTDRSLLVEDSRRVEPKKFKGPKARARFTKSYR